LDPFNKCGDLKIWEVMDSIHMRVAVEQLPDRLDSIVLESILTKYKTKKLIDRNLRWGQLQCRATAATVPRKGALAKGKNFGMK
jgi:hypothetical protein